MQFSIAQRSRRSRSTRSGGRAARASKGVPNKATQDVRAAIARFAEGNVGKLQRWFDAAAEKDPAKAADLFVRVLEYHIPKLARTEINGVIGVRGRLIISND